LHSGPARIIASPLALTPGTRLGVYEVTAQIGEGGMGQVYRATDTKLKRQVAIKILPPSLAADADRLARFQREAVVLASLNHPHIAAAWCGRARCVADSGMHLNHTRTVLGLSADCPLVVDRMLPRTLVANPNALCRSCRAGAQCVSGTVDLG
jgi:serine/threonine protein kinase